MSFRTVEISGQDEVYSNIRIYPYRQDDNVAYDNIDLELKKFIQSEINEWNPDLVIAVERKATAILRALKEQKDHPLDLKWANVISSTVIDQIPADELTNKRILVFDDMMMTGGHLKIVLRALAKKIKSNFSTEFVRVIVFGIDKDGSRLHQLDNLDFSFPHSWYYRDLTIKGYGNIRKAIVEMLVASGSLLLDTEHIEVRIKLSGHLNTLINALNRNGKTVAFNADDNNRNITVFYEDNKKIEFDKNKFPEGTKFDGIVKKCRIIQRDQTNEFAIIPICFPAIRLDAIRKWSNRKEIIELFGNRLSEDNFSAFYAVGLLAALTVLERTFKDLAASGIDLAYISLPSLSDIDNPLDKSFTLNHLRVMYPDINLKRLIDHEISTMHTKKWAKGNKLRGKQKEANQLLDTKDSRLYNEAIQLLQVVRREIDSRILMKFLERENEHDNVEHPFGLRAQEIFTLAQAIGLTEKERVSALFDILIDNAFLVTHVEEQNLESDSKWYVRTFEPDGEIVSDAIRKYTSENGLPYGYISS